MREVSPGERQCGLDSMVGLSHLGYILRVEPIAFAEGLIGDEKEE